VTRAERRKSPDYRIAELEAEVERLEAELLDASRMTSEQEAEIESLQRQLSVCKDIDKELSVLRGALAEKTRENERLRGTVDRQVQAEREVERLRAALEKIADPTWLEPGESFALSDAVRLARQALGEK
jgi:predicted RNase H-like nuclease (RuvC/YqgF family)